MEEIKKPIPPFNYQTATEKVRLAEDAWNSRDHIKVSMAYTEDSQWRNRSQFITGRKEIQEFLKGKWEKELEYKLIKELWAFHENQIAVRFQYEWCDEAKNWFRAYGNENWRFNENGLMTHRQASINDVAIQKDDRKFLWEESRRPDDYPILTELGL